MAIGRFFMATLTRFAFSQGNQPYSQRIPLHLFVDECQDYISDSMKQIVTKTRKFRLYGTFAQQFCGQGMDTELKRAIIGNSRIKISGGNELSSLKTIAAETGAPIEELQALDTGHFHIKAGKSPSVAVKIPRVPNSARLKPAQWKGRQKAQMAKFYRSIRPQSTERTDDPKQEQDSQYTPETSEQMLPNTTYTRRRKPAKNFKPPSS